MRILHIAFPKLSKREFDYLKSNEFDNVQIGCRVMASFRGHSQLGIIVGLSDYSDVPNNKLKQIDQVIDQEPLLTPDVIQLCQWASLYYHMPLGDIFFTALPKLLRIKQNLNSSKRKKSEKITCHSAKEVILNSDQKSVVDLILQQVNKHDVYLLEGVTGSGKTEVYLQIMQQVLAQDKSCLVLVPEIGLTPQTYERFQNRFKVKVNLLHSGLNDTERGIAWLEAKEGLSKIIIGTRSAIFTPIENLGLIIVDEEHDQSFKQQDSFRYSARDLAIVRAKSLNIPVILGSATPSLESIHNAKNHKRYQLVTLPTRAGNASYPDVFVIDTRVQKCQKGISPILVEKIKQHLAQGNQVLLFINRRGYAPVMMCHHCGWIIECKHCDARMTLHYSPRYLMCHHCGDRQMPMDECVQCKTKGLSPVGVGTEKIEEYLIETFPDFETIRIDRDSTRRKGSLQLMLDSIQQGAPKILIGTQMLAKGHHFPNVTMVGILNADTGFFSHDFRATERLGQLFIQVSGRAGRENKKGEVYIQTQHPEHPLLKQLLSHGFVKFAETLLSERQTLALPPFGYLALFRSHAKVADNSIQFLTQIKESCPSDLQQNVQLFGPVSSPMAKRAGQYHHQLLLQAKNRTSLQTLLKHVVMKINKEFDTKKIHWSLDVDPIELF